MKLTNPDEDEDREQAQGKGDIPLTRLTLIQKLRAGLHWSEFVFVYGPVLDHWVGLWTRNQADKEEFVQSALIKVWRSLPHYQPEKGRFRNWLFWCVRSSVMDSFRAKRQLGLQMEVGQLAQQVDDQDCDRIDDDDSALEAGLILSERMIEVMDWVKRRVEPWEWQAFLLMSAWDHTAPEAANRLGGHKPNELYPAVAKIRKLLRERHEAGPC